MMSDRSPDASIPRMQFVVIALLQGIALFALHQTLEHDLWPSTHFGWMMAIYSVVVALPLLVYLTANGNEAPNIGFYGYVAVCAAGMGAYAGWQMEPRAQISADYVMLSYIPTALVAVFLTALLRLRRVQGLDWYYASWRIAITGAWAWLFTAACFLVLSLWGGLFEALNILFFRDLFGETWFMYPVFSIAFASGVIVFRSKSNFSESLIRLQQIATPFFLVVVVAIVLMFMVTLAFTGLQPLWDTGGSALVLAFQALILYLMNAAYHGDDSRLPKLANSLVKLGLLAMPVLSGIIAYGLYLRIAQYGWTVSRLWGVSTALLLAGFGLFYAYSVARSGQGWLRRIDDFNGRLVWLVLAFVILVNTPVLDFRRITVSDQLNRVAQGVMSPDDLDIWYLGKQTGRAGYFALQDVKARYGGDYPKLAERIDRLDWDAETQTSALTLETLEDKFLWGDDLQHTRLQVFMQVLLQEINDNPWMYSGVSTFRVLELDVNDDGTTDYLLVTEQEFEVSLKLFVAPRGAEADWTNHPVATAKGVIFDEARTKLLKSLDAGEVQVVQPQWQDIVIGEQRLEVR